MSTLAPRLAHVNARRSWAEYDRFALDPNIDFPIAGADPLAPVFREAYFELRALQRRRVEVAS